jgi:hypothetical protein
LPKQEIIDLAVNQVKKLEKGFDAILILTKVGPCLERFQREFGEKLIYPNRERTEIDADWKGGDHSIQMSDIEYAKEFEEALLDVILASKSAFLIGGTSNMTLGALVFNPNLAFKSFTRANGK